MTTINIFISYSSKDRLLKDLIKKGLQNHLSQIFDYKFVFWSDEEIELGSTWAEDINAAMDKSKFCLALVSANFAASEYCTVKELGEYFKRKKEDKKVIILPVLVRSYDFTNFEIISTLQFFKTYFKEYGFTQPIERDNLLPFDKLGEDPNTTDKQLNDYYDKLARKILDVVKRNFRPAPNVLPLTTNPIVLLNIDDNTKNKEIPLVFTKIDNYKLVPINGEWIPNNNIISFIKGDSQETHVGACLAPIKLKEAEIEVEILFSKLKSTIGKTVDASAKILFNYNSKDHSYYAIGLGGYNSAYSLVKFSQEIGGWQAIKYLGTSASLREGQLYKLKACINEKSVDLFVNDVHIFNFNLVLSEELQIGLFAWGSEIIKFRNLKYKPISSKKNSILDNDLEDQNGKHLSLLTIEQKKLHILNFIKDKGTQQYSISQLIELNRDKIKSYEVHQIIDELITEKVFKKITTSLEGTWFIQDPSRVPTKIEELNQPKPIKPWYKKIETLVGGFITLFSVLLSVVLSQSKCNQTTPILPVLLENRDTTLIIQFRYTNDSLSLKELKLSLKNKQGSIYPDSLNTSNKTVSFTIAFNLLKDTFALRYDSLKYFIDAKNFVPSENSNIWTIAYKPPGAPSDTTKLTLKIGNITWLPILNENTANSKKIPDGSETLYTLKDAQSMCQKKGLRLPTREEQQALVKYFNSGATSKQKVINYFANNFSGKYGAKGFSEQGEFIHLWSSTPARTGESYRLYYSKGGNMKIEPDQNLTYLSCACVKDDTPSPPTTPPASIVKNGLRWMTQNLNVDSDGSRQHPNLSGAQKESFGRLYTFNDAARACVSIGWRIPTDLEWRNLLNINGGYNPHDNLPDNYYRSAESKGARTSLMRSANLSLKLGGVYVPVPVESGFRHLNTNGYYWSGGSKDPGNGIQIVLNTEDIFRKADQKENMASCRCVQNTSAFVPHVLLSDNLLWSIGNIRVDVQGSVMSNNGRLYTQSQARTACQNLASGWRLPTELEFRNLLKALEVNYKNQYDGDGLPIGTISSGGWGIFQGNKNQELKFTTDGKFNSGETTVKDIQNGYYWTSTPGIAFRIENNIVYRTKFDDINTRFSCKCVRVSDSN